MSKIYKTFDEWYDSLVLLKLSDKDHIVAQAAWNARNAEIEQLKQQRKEQEAIIQKLNMDRYDLQKEVEELKHQITKLEFSEEDAQQYALKCKTEIDQLNARLLSFESRYTCFNCLHGKSCKFAFDEYNTNGGCASNMGEARQPEIEQLKARVLELERLPKHILATNKELYYGMGNLWEVRQMADEIMRTKGE